MRTALVTASIVALALGCARTGAAPDPGAPPGPGSPAPARACRSAGWSASRFELAVLGSGGPHSVGRAASGYLLRVDGVPRILVDAGPGAFVRLGEMDVDFEALDTLLLTHLHIDHTGDVPGFVKSRDLSSDDSMTFRFFGPGGAGDYPSTTAFVDRLFGKQGAYAYLAKFRNDLRFVVTDLPIDAGAPIHEVLREGDLRVTSIAVDHDDVPAVAFRIEHAGHAVVVSGDLASKNDNLARLAAGADVLVYDAAVVDPPGAPGKLYDLHTAPHRIGEIAASARVRSVLLSHIAPNVESAKDDVLRSIRATFRGDVRFAEDCMRVDVTKP